MKSNHIFALIIGIIGLMIMFFFPEPETNFLYYASFVIIVGIIIWLLIKKKA